MAKWTIEQTPSLTGKTALVTGANSGLGLETARGLAARGANVVLACRSSGKADTAMADILGTVSNAKLSFLALDLSDLASIKQAAAEFKSTHSQLDILCNNAGVMGLPKGKTKDGFETIFGVNHLGHFALTGHLYDLISATPKARVVTVSSRTHNAAQLPLDDLNWQQRRYSRPKAYGQSKLANICFAFELERRLQNADVDALSVAAHPGYSATNVVFPSDAKLTLARRIWNPLAQLGNTLVAQSAAQGALPILYAATMPNVNGGEYYGPDGIAALRGYPALTAAAPMANDVLVTRKLWEQSEEMTGVRWL